MSETAQHTPGLLIAGWSGDPEAGPLDDAGPIILGIVGRGGIASCKLISTGHANTWEIVEANASRIAACWNACEGIPTEELRPLLDLAKSVGFVGGRKVEFVADLGEPETPAEDEPGEWKLAGTGKVYSRHTADGRLIDIKVEPIKEGEAQPAKGGTCQYCGAECVRGVKFCSNECANWYAKENRP